MKKIAFTIFDHNNEEYAKKFKNSLRKFHSEEELPLIEIDDNALLQIADRQKFYRMTPRIAKDLIQEYDLVIKFDCDQVVTGDLSELWQGKFDVGVVNNSNPRELLSMRRTGQTTTVWDIHPLAYVNCGLVVMQSKKFINHWWKLCTSEHFLNYQYREQDLLNILTFYGDYKVKNLDAGDSFYGLASKGYWPNITLDKGVLKLTKNDEWPTDRDKTIRIIHWAGGNNPNKMKFRQNFSPEVAKRLEDLTADNMRKKVE